MIPATTLATKSDIGILHQIPADPQDVYKRQALGRALTNGNHLDKVRSCLFLYYIVQA